MRSGLFPFDPNLRSSFVPFFKRSTFLVCTCARTLSHYFMHTCTNLVHAHLPEHKNVTYQMSCRTIPGLHLFLPTTYGTVLHSLLKNSLHSKLGDIMRILKMEWSAHTAQCSQEKPEPEKVFQFFPPAIVMSTSILCKLLINSIDYETNRLWSRRLLGLF